MLRGNKRMPRVSVYQGIERNGLVVHHVRQRPRAHGAEWSGVEDQL